MALSYGVTDSIREHLEGIFEQGNKLANQGKHDESSRCFEEAIQTKLKLDYKEFLDRGVQSAKSDRHEEAVGCFDEAIELRTDLSGMFYRQGALLDKHCMYDMAAKFCNKAGRIRNTGHALFVHKSMSLNSLGRYAESTRCFDEVIRLKRESPEAFNHMGVAMRGLGKYEDALAYIETALMMRSGYCEALFNKGRLLDDLGVHYKAVQCLDEVLRLDPGCYEALLYRGMALAHMGRHKDAVKSFDDLLRMRPDHFKALCNKAHSLYRLGSYAEAIRCYDMVAEARSDADIVSKRDALLKRQASVPERMLLPLLVLNAGGFRGRPRLQNVAFLVQRELDTHGYDFESRGFGPYSDEFVLDISSNPELITESVHQDGRTSEYYHEYSLTDRGKEQLLKLESLGGSTVKKAAACARGCKDLQVGRLLDDVYSGSAFGHNPPSGDEIAKDLKNIHDSITDDDDNYKTWQHLVIGAVTEYVEGAISNLGKAQNTAQKNAILNISKITTHTCGGIEKHMEYPIDSDRMRSAIAEPDGYARLLLEYCDQHEVMRNPHLLPLSELITEGEARRLRKSLSQEDILA